LYCPGIYIHWQLTDNIMINKASTKLSLISLRKNKTEFGY
jgi:hypothetical protein